MKRAYREITRLTGTTILRDAFGIVLAPSPLLVQTLSHYLKKAPRRFQASERPTAYEHRQTTSIIGPDIGSLTTPEKAVPDSQARASPDAQ